MNFADLPNTEQQALACAALLALLGDLPTVQDLLALARMAAASAEALEVCAIEQGGIWEGIPLRKSAA
jgi:hypothetical protein